MNEKKIPENGQLPDEDRIMKELPPEFLEKASGGILFPEGPSRCILCGKLCSSRLEYAKHVMEAHGQGSSSGLICPPYADGADKKRQKGVHRTRSRTGSGTLPASGSFAAADFP